MTRMRWARLSGGLAALFLMTLPAGAAAQHEDYDDFEDEDYYDDEDWGPTKGEFFLFGTAAVPVGEFQSFVDLGGGVGVGGLAYLNRDHSLAFRLEGTFVVYGSETFSTPLSPTVPFVDVDVRTTNYIASLGVGPQVFLGTGALRPYVFGTAGFSYFATQSSASGTHDIEPFASTTNFDDFTLALSGGGGFAVDLSQGEHPVSLDLSATYQRNGLTEYLTKGDLIELPGGGWTVDPIRSETNLVTYRVGVSIGIR